MRKVLCILIIIFLSETGWTQWNPSISESTGFVSSGLSFQQWSIAGSDHPIQEVVLPVKAFVPLQRGLYMNISNSPALARYHDTRLGGLSDTWLRITYLHPEEMIMANVGIGAPTGKTNLTVEEFGLSQLLSENAYRFRLPIYGQGLSAKIGLAMAYPLGEKYVVGVGLNYVYKLAYHPLDDASIEYQPGNEASIFLGIDVQLEENRKWNCDIIYTIYGVDKLSGNKVYESGNKLMINSSFLMGIREGFIWAAIRWRQKGKNEFWTGTSLEQESKNSNGNQFEVDGMWQFMRWREGVLRILAEGRYHARNEYGKRWAVVVGLGMGLVYPLSPVMSVNFNLKYLRGSFKSLEAMDQSGIDFLGGVTYQF